MNIRSFEPKCKVCNQSVCLKPRPCVNCGVQVTCANVLCENGKGGWFCTSNGCRQQFQAEKGFFNKPAPMTQDRYDHGQKMTPEQVERLTQQINDAAGLTRERFKRKPKKDPYAAVLKKDPYAAVLKDDDIRIRGTELLNLEYRSKIAAFTLDFDRPKERTYRDRMGRLWSWDGKRVG